MEQEINLRPYFEALVRRWRLIVLCMAVLGLLAVIVTLLLPPTYKANADVLLVSTRLQLQFDSRFITDDASQLANPVNRRDTLVALASSGTLEEQVNANLPDALRGQTFGLGDLVERVEVQPIGDLLRISVGDSDVNAARSLALAWAQNYVQLVNQIYVKDASSTDEITRQLADAQKRYDAKQKELETFIGSSQIVQLEQKVKMLEALLDGSREANQALYTQYLSRTHELELILNDAQTLRDQVATTGSANLSDSLAALALRARVAGGEQLPVDLRFDNPGALLEGQGATLADLDSLIRVVQERRTNLLAVAEQFAQAMATGQDAAGLTGQTRTQYERELTALNQQLEQQQSQRKFLEQQRNVALESLMILQRKLDEQQVATGTPLTEVRLVGTTIEPPRSIAARLILALGAALAAGLVLGVLLVLALEILRPWLKVVSPSTQSEQPGTRPAAG